jgi:hypothetical protein
MAISRHYAIAFGGYSKTSEQRAWDLGRYDDSVKVDAMLGALLGLPMGPLGMGIGMVTLPAAAAPGVFARRLGGSIRGEEWSEADLAGRMANGAIGYSLLGAPVGIVMGDAVAGPRGAVGGGFVGATAGLLAGAGASLLAHKKEQLLNYFGGYPPQPTAVPSQSPYGA